MFMDSLLAVTRFDLRVIMRHGLSGSNAAALKDPGPGRAAS